MWMKTRRRASTSVTPISATDPDEDGEDNDDLEFGDTLTYSLEGDGRRHRSTSTLRPDSSSRRPRWISRVEVENLQR